MYDTIFEEACRTVDDKRDSSPCFFSRGGPPMYDIDTIFIPADRGDYPVFMAMYQILGARLVPGNKIAIDVQTDSGEPYGYTFYVRQKDTEVPGNGSAYLVESLLVNSQVLYVFGPVLGG